MTTESRKITRGSSLICGAVTHLESVAKVLRLTAAAFALAANAALAQQAGTISGRVLNPVQGEYVRSAEIRVDGMQIVANSDANGLYRLHNVPAGQATITVTYTGYQPASASVLVVPGREVIQNFELRSTEISGRPGDAVKMDAYTVVTGREGQAKAIMEQKAAMTATNVISADAYGSLVAGNVAELLQYLPGVEVNPDGALSSTISIRGMGPDYGGLTIDGMAALATTHTGSRAPAYIRTNQSAIDLVELNKTVSADMDASAPAGTVNLKSKSAFQRTERYIGWQIYGAGTSADMNFNRSYGAGEGRRQKFVPGGSLEYSDTSFNGKLGLVATVASTTSHLPHYSVSTTYDKTPTAARPSPIAVTSLAFNDIPVRRHVINSGLSLDYKLGKNTILSLRGQDQQTTHKIYQRTISLIATRAALDPASDGNTMNAIAGPAGVNNPRMTLNSTQLEREQENWMIKPSITFTGDKLELDLALAYSSYDHTRSQGILPRDGFGGGALSGVASTLFPIGWTASRSDGSSTAWNFRQTSGADFKVLNNWNASAAANNVTRAIEDTGRLRYIGQLNVKYRTDFSAPTFLKVGLKSDEQIYRLNSPSYSYTYVGPTGNRAQAIIPVAENTIDLNPERYGTLFASPVYVSSLNAMTKIFSEHRDYFIPAATNATSATNLYPDRYVRERIDSAYLMANTQWNKWAFQGGVRTENTQHVYRVYERGVAGKRSGKYDGVFFSGAAKYRFRPDLIATASFSQSVRRPNNSNLTGLATINDDLMTGNIPNPELKPEWGNNYSARLEYYFEPAGNVAAGLFKSDVSDLIYQRTLVPAEEMGLGKDYPGYLFTSFGNRNAKFRIQGFELEYRQQLIFLPGALRGIGVFANYTRTTNSDPNYQFNIAPATASTGINFRYRRLNTGIRGSWTDEKLFSATEYVKPRAMVGVTFDYKMTDKTTLFVTGRDITKSPIQRYDRAFRDYQTYDYRFATQWTIGVSGSF